MNTNYTILQKNTLDGLSETAGYVYLLLYDKYEAHTSKERERKAFFEACRYDRYIGSVLKHVLENGIDWNHPSFKVDVDVNDTTSALNEFFARRYINNFIDR